jgi:hypothetical protein
MKSDFVTVQLSAAAAELGAVRVSTAHFSYTFEPNKPVRVLTSEWAKVLRKETHNGEPILEIAPEGEE